MRGDGNLSGPFSLILVAGHNLGILLPLLRIPNHRVNRAADVL
jgi:hypothetical protein